MSTTNYTPNVSSIVRKRRHDPIDAGIEDPIVNIPEANINKSALAETEKKATSYQKRPIQKYSWIIVIILTILAFATRFYKISSGGFVL